MRQFNIHQTAKVKELSRGMTVKLMISLALSHHPDLLILDEPTSGLDPVAREEICELIQDFVTDESKSVLFSTHITSDLEAIADFIVFILNGQIIYSGPTEELLESYLLIKGDNNDLKAIDSEVLIGLKSNMTGFEALISKDTNINLQDVLIEPITLEQLIIFFNRGGYHE